VVDLGFVVFAIMAFSLLVWPALTYAGDALRYLLWRLKGVRK
jgi:hypothetical protein